jgi:hypothetical protein
VLDESQPAQLLRLLLPSGSDSFIDICVGVLLLQHGVHPPAGLAERAIAAIHLWNKQPHHQPPSVHFLPYVSTEPVLERN